MLAFDTGPANALLDDAMFKRLGKARDEGGPGTGLEVVCDGCEEKLLGDEQVWVGADECDYCAACQANGGCGEGVWKTARQRIAEADKGEEEAS